MTLQANGRVKVRAFTPYAVGIGMVSVAALSASACASKDPAAAGEGGPAIPGAIRVTDVGFLAPDETGSGTPGGRGFAACAETVAQAEARSADMFVMLDHSGSMGNDCPLNLDGTEPGNNSKWCFATHAFAEYFTSVAAVGNRAALQFMSQPDFVCNGGPNNGGARAFIELTDLPVAEDHALIRALADDGPTGGMGTRIEPALHGIADYTVANQTPGRTMIGVLVTDGDPNGCEDNIGDLSNIIEEHFTDTGIRTFVIGMTGASLNNLERFASVGGAPEHGPEFCGGQDDCHFWSVGDGDPVAFVDALSQIEAAAVVPCSYGIPDPPPGDVLDNTLVNVLFKAGDGSEFVIGRVNDCGNTGGWVYDDPMNPSLIHLCSATCEAVTAEGLGATLDIAYGCNSVIR